MTTPPPRIPRAVHLIWMQGAEAMPPKYAPNLAAWRRLHPKWEVRFWSGAEIHALAAERYPRWAHLVDPVYVPTLIERADVGRTIILHAHGGVYADLDYEPTRPLDPLLAEQEAAAAARGWPDFAVLPGSILGGVNNCVLMSTPGATFWTDAFWPYVESRLRGPRGLEALPVALAPPFRTLMFTGPYALGAARRRSSRVLMTPRGVIFSLRHGSAGSYGVHTYDSTWVNSSGTAPRITAALVLVSLVVLGLRSVLRGR